MHGLEDANNKTVDAFKTAYDHLLNCFPKLSSAAPARVVILSQQGVSSYDDRTQTIYLTRENLLGHEGVLVHEYAHYLDDTLFSFSLPCATTLFDAMSSATDKLLYGDGVGWPYCYMPRVPNAIEYIAIVAEGYCTDQCGPTYDYLHNVNNSIALSQRECVERLGLSNERRTA